jgi:predicted SnoaL-like aldol condensation-catalyzing enzyme
MRMAMQTLKHIAVDFLKQIVDGDIAGAYERYVGDVFRHHNPHFAGDSLSLRKGMEEDEARNPGKKLEVQVALQEGDYVAVHSRLRRGSAQPDIAVVHIFRFEDGRIVELWDIAQVAPEEIVNENGMF